MKAQLKKIARMMSGWPLIGRFVRIGIGVIRLPEFRAAFLDFNQRQLMFETEQLPTLLQTLSDLNHRQLASDTDRDNLVQSVPVALRKITRDLVAMEGQLESISSSMEQRLSETRGQLETVSTSMEQRLSETRGQLESLRPTVQYLLGRLEFVRREIMFEMRYGAATPPGDGERIKARTKILSADKLPAARSGRLRLNLGCGHIPLEGYVNVDRRTLPGVNIVAEVDDLPFEPGEVDEIFSAHLLEHFPQEQLRRKLLPYFRSLLKEGGRFHAVVPDAEAMIREYSTGQYPYEDMREAIYGAQDYDGDFHFNMFTPQTLSELLLESGFKNPVLIECGRKNGRCYEFEILGIKA